MKRNELKQRTDNAVNETHVALQIVWDNTNKGQRNKMLKNVEIKELLDRYGINYEQT